MTTTTTTTTQPGAAAEAAAAVERVVARNTCHAAVAGMMATGLPSLEAPPPKSANAPIFSGQSLDRGAAEERALRRRARLKQLKYELESLFWLASDDYAAEWRWTEDFYKQRVVDHPVPEEMVAALRKARARLARVVFGDGAEEPPRKRRRAFS